MYGLELLIKNNSDDKELKFMPKRIKTKLSKFMLKRIKTKLPIDLISICLKMNTHIFYFTGNYFVHMQLFYSHTKMI